MKQVFKPSSHPRHPGSRACEIGEKSELLRATELAKNSTGYQRPGLSIGRIDSIYLGEGLLHYIPGIEEAQVEIDQEHHFMGMAGS